MDERVERLDAEHDVIAVEHVVGVQLIRRERVDVGKVLNRLPRRHVFTADACEGTLTETDEAAPFWCPEADIPYGRMWSDDRLWIPLMQHGRRFEAQFVFDGDLMLWHLLQAAPA